MEKKTLSKIFVCKRGEVTQAGEIYIQRSYMIYIPNQVLLMIKRREEKRTALFCVTTQRVVVIHYRRFGTTYWVPSSRVKNSQKKAGHHAC